MEFRNYRNEVEITILLSVQVMNQDLYRLKSFINLQFLSSTES